MPESSHQAPWTSAPRRAGLRPRARRGTRASRAAIVGLSLIVLLPGAAMAHEERHVTFPEPPGRVPTYRTSGPYLVVCRPDTPGRISAFPEPLRSYNQRLYSECVDHGFRNLQAAADHVQWAGTRILIQPGVYLEEPSLRPARGYCGKLQRQVDGGDTVLSYRQQRRCPHVENLVAIFGDGPDEGTACDGPLCHLQVEGTGRSPLDTVIDGRFHKLNVVRADRADGVYFRNFTVQRSTFNAVYVIQTDGFVIDRMLARWDDEYGFLTFASDHGLYTDCEAHGNGDGGIYPGSAADLHGTRVAIEIRRCRSHHNLLGLSGTAGNSLYVHDNWFYDNTVGIVNDSAFPNHPGLPQDHSTYVHNVVFSNNADFYKYEVDGTCSKPQAQRGYERGVVCPRVGVPIGVGVMLAGGNWNRCGQNWIFDNWRYGGMLFYVPAVVRNDPNPADQYDTSHHNRYRGNYIGLAPDRSVFPNGLDFYWDEEGAGNCWEGNVSGPGQITSDPKELPTCTDPSTFHPSDPVKSAYIGYCALAWNPETNPKPAGCDWYQTPPRPRG